MYSPVFFVFSYILASSVVLLDVYTISLVTNAPKQMRKTMCPLRFKQRVHMCQLLITTSQYMHLVEQFCNVLGNGLWGAGGGVSVDHHRRVLPAVNQEFFCVVYTGVKREKP